VRRHIHNALPGSPILSGLSANGYCGANQAQAGGNEAPGGVSVRISGAARTLRLRGFTHYCGQRRNGAFIVWRVTAKKRLAAKLRQIKAELRRRMHDPVASVGEWLLLAFRHGLRRWFPLRNLNVGIIGGGRRRPQ
jgi:hypothetical protein